MPVTYMMTDPVRLEAYEYTGDNEAEITAGTEGNVTFEDHPETGRVAMGAASDNRSTTEWLGIGEWVIFDPISHQARLLTLAQMNGEFVPYR
jgi:hypothetical protein